MAGQVAGEIRQRVRRVGDHHQHSLWYNRDDSRHDVGVDLRVGVQQAQAALCIGAICGAPGLLVRSRSDDHQCGVDQILITTRAHVHDGRERRRIAHVSRYTGRAISGPIHQHDLPARVG